MISQEARDLFAANVKAMTAGDAAHLPPSCCRTM